MSVLCQCAESHPVGPLVLCPSKMVARKISGMVGQVDSQHIENSLYPGLALPFFGCIVIPGVRLHLQAQQRNSVLMRVTFRSAQEQPSLCQPHLAQHLLRPQRRSHPFSAALASFRGAMNALCLPLATSVLASA